MRYLRLAALFARTSLQEELAYRANVFIAVLHSFLNLGTGVLGVWVLFGQVETVQGWDFNRTLALLGVYLTVGALRGLVFGPSLESLAGMDGDVWSGRMDFTLLRPVDTQVLVSVRKWEPFAVFDLVLGLGVLGVAMSQLQQTLSLANLGAFVLALGAGITILYAILLIFAAFVFWSPGVLFTWVFDALFQTARYPLGMYPGWLRLVLTWIVPVGVITTVPAEALAGMSTPAALASSVALAAALFTGASLLFRVALRRYASASS